MELSVDRLTKHYGSKIAVDCVSVALKPGDWGGAIPARGFAPYLIPMEPDPADMRHLGTSPSGTALFFRVLGRNKSLGEYQLYIEANFNGYQYLGFQLKKAYAIINDFTIGYASSTFSDPAALPPTVDAQGPNNKISPAAVLVRYMHTFKDRWTAAVSVEAPENSIGADNEYTEKASPWVPDFAAFMQYQWAAGQHVRLAGIMRTLSYRDLINARNHNTVGCEVWKASLPLKERQPRGSAGRMAYVAAPPAEERTRPLFAPLAGSPWTA